MKAARGSQSQSCRIDNQIAGTMKMYLSTPDIEATFKQLRAKGVKPLPEITKDTWGTWFDLNDPDGNHWLVVQS